MTLWGLWDSIAFGWFNATKGVRCRLGWPIDYHISGGGEPDTPSRCLACHGLIEEHGRFWRWLNTPLFPWWAAVLAFVVTFAVAYAIRVG